MGGHSVLKVDRLPSAMARHQGEDNDVAAVAEAEPLIPVVAECRICQEEDSVENLDTPCMCCGSLKYAHRHCVQHWCNEKGDIICEICHQPYQHGYTAPPRPPPPEEIAIDIGGGWTISGTPLDLNDPRLLAMAEAERQFLETEYDDYSTSNATGAAFCRAAALILLGLLLLRHACTVTDVETDDDDYTVFSIFVIRAAGFLLPCYIMAWAVSILQRRRHRQVRKWKQQRWQRHNLHLYYSPDNTVDYISPLHLHPGLLLTPKSFDSCICSLYVCAYIYIYIYLYIQTPFLVDDDLVEQLSNYRLEECFTTFFYSFFPLLLLSFFYFLYLYVGNIVKVGLYPCKL